MNGQRSGRDFVRDALAQLNPKEQLALVAYKEQFLLYLDRPTVNFGHRRWLEGAQESYDAALWLNAAPNRVLLVPESTLKKYPCFVVAVTPVGVTSRRKVVPGARSGGAKLRRAGRLVASHFVRRPRALRLNAVRISSNCESFSRWTMHLACVLRFL